MRLSIVLLMVVVASAMVIVNAQEPIPPPIWPVSFQAKFGLSDSPIIGTNVVNSTSYFYYNMADGVTAQLIDYPDFCPPSPKLIGGLYSGCQVLFNEAGGIYITQPSIGVECCLLFAGVGPTPRNFTNGFTWAGTEVAQDYWGISRDSDYWTGGSWPFEFKYWTELETHHDVYFHDGAGANWAWDHLNVTTVDPSVFDLFSDPDICSQSCGLKHFGVSTEEVQSHAAMHGPISLALHHHQMKMKGEELKQEGKGQYVPVQPRIVLTEV